MEDTNMVSLNEFANGALAARFNEELQKVLENIADPNTEPHKNRKITVEVTLAGDENREIIDVLVVAKSKLLHAKHASTKLIMGVDENLNIVGQELKSGLKGQMFIDSENEVVTDTGEKLDETDKVIDFRKTKEQTK